MQDGRYEPRETKVGHYSLTWKDRDGRTYSMEARGVDASPSGVGIECDRELKAGSIVYVQSRDGRVEGNCTVG